MSQETETKLIRLNTGEDIIANCIIDVEGGSILVSNPMKVYVRRMAEMDQKMLIMMPWLPLELIEEDFASIDYSDVITIVQPKKTFIDYYFDTVEQYQAAMLQSEENGEINFGENDLEEDVDEETMQEMLDILKERKKNSIH